MITKRFLAVGGAVVALAIPAGVAVAATTPSPNPSGTTQQNGPGYRHGPGPGHGPMGGGYGDPEDCPYYNSTEHQKWLKERDQLRQQMQERMHDRWANGGSSTS